jgi:hypothetical protein
MTTIERQSSVSWISEAPSTAPQAFDNLFASGELLPTQLASRSNWGAEKKLAAAVFESALAEIRDHCGAKGHLRAVKDALEWVRSDDTEWPYSFRPLCELFAIDPEWVRERVAVWTVRPRVSEGPRVRYRHAA